VEFDIYVPVYPSWDMSLYELEFLISRPHTDRALKVVKCEGDLSFCPVREESSNPEFTCQNCQNLQLRNIDYLEKYSKYHTVEIVNTRVSDERTDPPQLIDESEIENFTYSTLVTFRKSEVVSSSDPLFQCIWETIINSINLADKLIEDDCIEVILFNGRMARYWPFKIIAKDRLKDTSITEAPLVGYNNMLITKNNYLHDQVSFSEELKDANSKLHNSSPLQLQLKRLANNWYEERIGTNYSSFSSAFNNSAFVTKDFTAPLHLPVREANVKLVSFFVSSPFDMANIKEKTDAFDGNQIDIIKAISEIEDIHLVVRIHPNMRNSDDNFYKSLQSQLSIPVTIIQPQHMVNSYELIKSSDIIISAGSTVNAEAAFLGKQSVLCGSAPYSRFGISLIVSDLDALTSNLTNFDHPYWSSTNPEVLKKRAIDYAVSLQALGHRSRRIFRVFDRSLLFLRARPVFSDFKIRLLMLVAKKWLSK
jgi:hypothetical protein